MSKQVFKSIESANASLPKCPKPLAESDGNHWWYIDHEKEELKAETGIGQDSFSCVCKTCNASMELSADAEDVPL